MSRLALTSRRLPAPRVWSKSSGSYRYSCYQVYTVQTDFLGEGLCRRGFPVYRTVDVRYFVKQNWRGCWTRFVRNVTTLRRNVQPRSAGWKLWRAGLRVWPLRNPSISTCQAMGAQALDAGGRSSTGARTTSLVSHRLSPRSLLRRMSRQADLRADWRAGST